MCSAGLGAFGEPGDLGKLGGLDCTLLLEQGLRSDLDGMAGDTDEVTFAMYSNMLRNTVRWKLCHAQHAQTGTGEHPSLVGMCTCVTERAAGAYSLSSMIKSKQSLVARARVRSCRQSTTTRRSASCTTVSFMVKPITACSGATAMAPNQSVIDGMGSLRLHFGP